MFVLFTFVFLAPRVDLGFVELEAYTVLSSLRYKNTKSQEEFRSFGSGK